MQHRKIKLTVQYDGFDYRGWQIQPGKRTIQGELSHAVSELVGHKITVHAASRTDAGVSALGQSAVFEVISPIPTENFKDAINDRLPRDIVVTSAELASKDFDVMGDVTSKLYRYTIYTGKPRPVFDIRHCWHIPKWLDVPAMDKAAKLLVGTHDFKSFAAARDKRDSTVRTIFSCSVTTSPVIPTPVFTGVNPGRRRASLSQRKQPAGIQTSPAQPHLDVPRYEIRDTRYEWVYVDIEGNAFLYNMVRNIAGTLVEVGTGRMNPGKITEILDAKNRTAAGPIAPPYGLCLIWVKY